MLFSLELILIRFLFFFFLTQFLVGCKDKAPSSKGNTASAHSTQSQSGQAKATSSPKQAQVHVEEVAPKEITIVRHDSLQAILDLMNLEEQTEKLKILTLQYTELQEQITIDGLLQFGTEEEMIRYQMSLEQVIHQIRKTIKVRDQFLSLYGAEGSLIFDMDLGKELSGAVYLEKQKQKSEQLQFAITLSEDQLAHYELAHQQIPQLLKYENKIENTEITSIKENLRVGQEMIELELALHAIDQKTENIKLAFTVAKNIVQILEESLAQLESEVSQNYQLMADGSDDDLVPFAPFQQEYRAAIEKNILFLKKQLPLAQKRRSELAHMLENI